LPHEGAGALCIECGGGSGLARDKFCPLLLTQDRIGDTLCRGIVLLDAECRDARLAGADGNQPMGAQASLEAGHYGHIGAEYIGDRCPVLGLGESPQQSRPPDRVGFPQDRFAAISASGHCRRQQGEKGECTES
jgi:hypothetical protein